MNQDRHKDAKISDLPEKPLNQGNPNYPPYQIPRGRPTDYLPEYAERLITFFKTRNLTKILKRTYTTKAGTVIEDEIEKPEELPTIEEFCESIPITKKTFHEWKNRYPEFLYAYERAKQIFRDFIVKNGITGRYDSRFAMFVAINDTDMKPADAPQIGAPVKIQVINYYDQRGLKDQPDEMLITCGKPVDNPAE